jgi:RNA polymerase sigma factor (sigma-70 family)
MKRVLCLVRKQLAALEGETDRRLLDSFLADHDEAAFAELTRRHGPLVWGVCRRWLANHQDAEDAFQATFLVLIRRAAAISPDTPLGPWLHRTAVMTARNVSRQNRRHAAISGPMEHDFAAAEVDPARRIELDEALLALPERDRIPVVLCHLQGLTRCEAAERLACPEGTLSARLHRALARLRVRLGGREAQALAVTAGMAIPANLLAATVRSAVVFTTSTSTGVSPAVARLTDGVLQMFWMKKLQAGLAAIVLVAGGLLAGFAARFDGVARATEPAQTAPLVGEPPATPEDPGAAMKRIEMRIEELRRQRELLGAMEMDLFAAKEKLEAAKQAKADAAAAAELGRDLAIEVGEVKSPFTVREVVNGKVAVVTCSNLDVLRTYLTRAFNDPQGPKLLRVAAHKDHPTDDLQSVFAACAAAGFAKASFSHYERRVRVEPYTTVFRTKLLLADAVPSMRPGVIDLTKYASRRR